MRKTGHQPGREETGDFGKTLRPALQSIVAVEQERRERLPYLAAGVFGSAGRPKMVKSAGSFESSSTFDETAFRMSRIVSR